MSIRQPSVLYVDDEEMNLTLFKITFQDKFQIHIARDGQEGLSLLQDKGRELDTVVSDMRMPGMDGVDFIAQAKEKFPHLRCFILTGFPSNEKVRSALKDQLIINSFSKPFDMEMIQKAVLNTAS
ncbi:MAG: response regulator [Cytophagales bacterium]|nr:response regulator [Cytophagales bacterium]